VWGGDPQEAQERLHHRHVWTTLLLLLPASSRLLLPRACLQGLQPDGAAFDARTAVVERIERVLRHMPDFKPDHLRCVRVCACRPFTNYAF
jgi:hypothetical protein